MQLCTYLLLIIQVFFYLINVHIAWFFKDSNDFISIFLLFLSLNVISLLSSLMIIFTSVFPFSLVKSDIFWSDFISFGLRTISLIGLLIISFIETIFFTLIFLNLFTSSEEFLIIVIINELPSIKIFLFFSNTSEKTNNSKETLKSENFTIA